MRRHPFGYGGGLLTTLFCWGTAKEIWNLSAFTEFYLKASAQNLPCFVKDADVIYSSTWSKSKRAWTPSTWYLGMQFPRFPNINDNCIIEAVEICLKYNCQFFGQNCVRTLLSAGAIHFVSLSLSNLEKSLGQVGDKWHQAPKNTYVSLPYVLYQRVGILNDNPQQPIPRYGKLLQGENWMSDRESNDNWMIWH